MPTIIKALYEFKKKLDDREIEIPAEPVPDNPDYTVRYDRKDVPIRYDANEGVSLAIKETP